MDKFIFKELTEQHLPELLEIYNYYVLNTLKTFDIEVVSLQGMRNITILKNPRYKSFIIIAQEIICGYVILHQFRKRAAYDDSAEVSIYLHKDYVGRGLGSLALSYIENVAREQNFRTLIAIISDANPTSQQAFLKNGYVKCAHYQQVGRKFGQILDSTSYQKILE